MATRTHVYTQPRQHRGPYDRCNFPALLAPQLPNAVVPPPSPASPCAPSVLLSSRRAVGLVAMEIELFKSKPGLFRVASTVLHGVAGAHFWFAAIYDYTYVNVPITVSPIFNSYGRQFKFLTYWDVCLQAAYMSYAFGLDVLSLFQKNRKDETTQKLVRFKDTVEASIALPIAMFVSITFWGLMAVDRELVLPSKVDPYFPEWLNHMEHTNIIIFQILEIVTSPRVYPSNKVGLVTLGVFQSSYLIWMHIVYYKSGIWVYPIFKQLTPPFRALFLAGSVCTCFIFYFVGSFANWFLWSGDKTKKEDDWEPVTQPQKPAIEP